MSRDDEPEDIPSIVPTRDDDEVPAAAPRSSSGRGATPRAGASRGAARPAPASGGGSVFLRLVATVSLVVAAVACAWAWQLEERLTQTGFQLERYEERIGELEARLSDTDEGLSQNTAAMAVKIKELYSEVDKLWASAWRRNKARLDEIEGTNNNQGESIAALKKDVAAANSDLARLKGVAGDLERLMANAKANQAQVERVADTLNRLDLEMSRLAKRVEANEGWVESINAFRRQVNASISQLEGSVRTLQQGPAAGGPGA
jgi:septal ring factor EnvC (AmiA/AmiB activator)